MTYTISTTKRNLIILTAAFLTVFSLYNAFYLIGIKPGSVQPDSAKLIIRDLLFVIPYAYLVIVLYDYFRHQGWKVLQYTMLMFLILEIGTKTFKTINILDPIITPNIYYTGFIGLFWFIIIIVQAIFLLQLKRKAYPEVFSLQKYAVALILFQLVAFGIPIVFASLFKSKDTSSMMLVIRILSAIPYLFLIEFAMKLHLRKGNLISDNAL